MSMVIAFIAGILVTIALMLIFIYAAVAKIAKIMESEAWETNRWRYEERQRQRNYGE